jgi:hypothetical protein
MAYFLKCINCNHLLIIFVGASDASIYLIEKKRDVQVDFGYRDYKNSVEIQYPFGRTRFYERTMFCHLIIIKFVYDFGE